MVSFDKCSLLQGTLNQTPNSYASSGWGLRILHSSDLAGGSNILPEIPMGIQRYLWTSYVHNYEHKKGHGNGVRLEQGITFRQREENLQRM